MQRLSRIAISPRDQGRGVRGFCQRSRREEVSLVRSWPAFAASLLRRGILRLSELAWFTEPKLAAGERRMVDLTGIEPVTS